MEHYFAFQSSLRVYGAIPSLDEITRGVGVVPTEVHRIGDRRGPRSPPQKHDMWSYKAAVEETRPLDEHLLALWASIKPGAAYVRSLKDTLTVDIFCGYRSSSATAGFEIDHKALEIFRELEVPLYVSVIVTG